jgi:RNA-dependent RNA polymerase
MEKKHKRPGQIYTSQEILGQLYDMVERVDFVPEQAPFDRRILDAYELDENLLSKARKLKHDYDVTIKRIMAQHTIGTEIEVWSAFVLQHNQERNDYTFAEELGKNVWAVKETFRNQCIEAAGGHDFDRLGPFVAAMYTVTAQESNDTDKSSRMISFPWMFDKELGQIAVRKNQRRTELGLQRRIQPGRSGNRPPIRFESSDEDLVFLGEQPVHRGEVLNLFQDSEEVDLIQFDDIGNVLTSGTSKDLEDSEEEIVVIAGVTSTAFDRLEVLTK